MTELSELPPDRRAASYRALADDAEREAARARNEAMRSAYLLMAQQWLQLAEEVETAAKRMRAVAERAPESARAETVKQV
jgi:hypothetical protein